MVCLPTRAGSIGLVERNCASDVCVEVQARNGDRPWRDIDVHRG